MAEDVEETQWDDLDDSSVISDLLERYISSNMSNSTGITVLETRRPHSKRRSARRKTRSRQHQSASRNNLEESLTTLTGITGTQMRPIIDARYAALTRPKTSNGLLRLGKPRNSPRTPRASSRATHHDSPVHYVDIQVTPLSPRPGTSASSSRTLPKLTHPGLHTPLAPTPPRASTAHPSPRVHTSLARQTLPKPPAALRKDRSPRKRITLDDLGLQTAGARLHSPRNPTSSNVVASASSSASHVLASPSSHSEQDRQSLTLDADDDNDDNDNKDDDDDDMLMPLQQPMPMDNMAAPSQPDTVAIQVPYLVAKAVDSHADDGDVLYLPIFFNVAGKSRGGTFNQPRDPSMPQLSLPVHMGVKTGAWNQDVRRWMPYLLDQLGLPTTEGNVRRYRMFAPFQGCVIRSVHQIQGMEGWRRVFVLTFLRTFSVAPSRSQSKQVSPSASGTVTPKHMPLSRGARQLQAARREEELRQALNRINGVLDEGDVGSDELAHLANEEEAQAVVDEDNAGNDTDGNMIAAFDYNSFLTLDEQQRAVRRCIHCDAMFSQQSLHTDPSQAHCSWHPGRFMFGRWTCCKSFKRNDPSEHCEHGTHTGLYIVPVRMHAHQHVAELEDKLDKASIHLNSISNADMTILAEQAAEQLQTQHALDDDQHIASSIPLSKQQPGVSGSAHPARRQRRPRALLRIFFNHTSQGHRGGLHVDSPSPPTLSMSVHVDGKNGTDTRRVVKRITKKLGMPADRARSLVLYSPWYGILIDDVRLLHALSNENKQDVVLVSTSSLQQHDDSAQPTTTPNTPKDGPVTPKGPLARRGREIQLMREHSFMSQSSTAESDFGSPTMPMSPLSPRRMPLARPMVKQYSMPLGPGSVASDAGSEDTTHTNTSDLSPAELLALCNQNRRHNHLLPPKSQESEASDDNPDSDDAAPQVPEVTNVLEDDFAQVAQDDTSATAAVATQDDASEDRVESLETLSRRMLDTHERTSFAERFDYTLFLTSAEQERVWRKCTDCGNDQVSVASRMESSCTRHVGQFRFGRWTCCQSMVRKDKGCVESHHRMQNTRLVVPIQMDVTLDLSELSLDGMTLGDGTTTGITGPRELGERMGAEDLYPEQNELFVVDSEGLLKMKEALSETPDKLEVEPSPLDAISATTGASSMAMPWATEDPLGLFTTETVQLEQGHDVTLINDVRFTGTAWMQMHAVMPNLYENASNEGDGDGDMDAVRTRRKLLRTTSSDAFDRNALSSALSKQIQRPRSISVNSPLQPRTSPPRNKMVRKASIHDHRREAVAAVHALSLANQSDGDDRDIPSALPGHLAFEQGIFEQDMWRPNTVVDSATQVELVFTTDEDAHYGEFNVFVPDVRREGQSINAAVRSQAAQHASRHLYTSQQMYAHAIRSLLAHDARNSPFILSHPVSEWVFGTDGMFCTTDEWEEGME